MKSKEAMKSTLNGAAIILLGELIVSLIIVGVYLLIDKFNYKVVTGVALGSFVTLINFLILSISVNRAIDKFLMKMSNEELDEEAAEKFATENAAAVQFAATGSYVARTIIMLATLVVAFILEQFNVLATLIPLLAYRPIIFVSELLRRKRKEM